MITSILIGTLVVGFILYRQIRPRAISDSPKTPLILMLVGLVVTARTIDAGGVDVLDIALLIVSTIVGVALSLVRSHTVAVYRDETTGYAFTRGTPVTVGLWLAAIGIHVGIDLASHSDLGNSTLLLYLGVVLLVQNVVVAQRARRAGLAFMPQSKQRRTTMTSVTSLR